MTEPLKDKRGAHRKGSTHTPEARQRISDGNRRAWATGKRVITPEHREKINAAQHARKERNRLAREQEQHEYQLFLTLKRKGVSIGTSVSLSEALADAEAARPTWTGAKAEGYVEYLRENGD